MTDANEHAEKTDKARANTRTEGASGKSEKVMTRRSLVVLKNNARDSPVVATKIKSLSKAVPLAAAGTSPAHVATPLARRRSIYPPPGSKSDELEAANEDDDREGAPSPDDENGIENGSNDKRKGLKQKRASGDRPADGESPRPSKIAKPRNSTLKRKSVDSTIAIANCSEVSTSATEQPNDPSEEASLRKSIGDLLKKRSVHITMLDRHKLAMDEHAYAKTMINFTLGTTLMKLKRLRGDYHAGESETEVSKILEENDLEKIQELIFGDSKDD
jgi:hypothetical protein